MASRRRFVFCFVASVLIISFLSGCGPMTATVVSLSREKYSSKLNPKDYESLKGKRILFDSIEDKSTNTTNLGYYNPERNIGYDLYYEMPKQGMAQPVVSFFWYALKKGFDHTGVIIEEFAPVYDAQMTMTFNSLTDREINFNVVFSRKGELLYQRSYVVKSSGDETRNEAILEERAYGMLDSIIKTILDDPDFKKIMDKKNS